MQMVSTVALFLASAAIVVWAGMALATSADVIAERGKLGKLWVGSLLLAGATSLPELITSISSGVMDLPDIAVGNVFGSNIFNITLIAAADFAAGSTAILTRVSRGHTISATLGMLLATMAAIAMRLNMPVSIAWVGLDTAIITVVYFMGVRVLTRYERTLAADLAFGTDPQLETAATGEGLAVASSSDGDLRKAIVKFAISGLAVVGAGFLLTVSGDRLAELTGIGQTFVGSIFVAAATSLPEAVTTISAVRVRAYDLAVGNVLGSNIFNMIILLWADLAYLKGPILSNVSGSHINTALFGLLLSGFVVMGLICPSKKKYLRLSPESILLLVVYVLATYVLFVGR